MKWFGAWLGFSFCFLVFVFYLLTNVFKIDEEKLSLMNEEIRRVREARRLADDAVWKMRTTSTVEQRRLYGEALRQIGWNCPDVKNIRWDDEDANGKHAKIMCGPDNGSGDVYKDRIFSTTLRVNGRFEAKQVGLMD